MRSGAAVAVSGQRLSERARMFWRFAQATALIATVGVVVGLFLEPDTTLPVLWDVIIPLVPASLLLSPAIWRNVCPLATLNIATNGAWNRRRLRGRWVRAVGVGGIALLLILVPARRFLFNHDGPALAITIILVALLALALGTLFELKAGFCNALCPVLPVERLYGQRPLLDVGNPRCSPCTLCTPIGCLDVSPIKALRQIVGPARRGAWWVFTGFGAFAAAFPGFVIAYYTVPDGPLSTAATVYLHIAIWMAVSYAAVTILVMVFGSPARVALPWLAATAAGLYYWFASPLVATALRLGDPGAATLRFAAFALIAVWLSRTLRPVLSAGPAP